MRLSPEEIKVLKDKVSVLNAHAQLYLFGSRVDDSAKGGDIDLLLVSNVLSQKEIRLLRLDFYSHFGEQKLDIVLDDGTFSNPFHRHILQKAVLL